MDSPYVGNSGNGIAPGFGRITFIGGSDDLPESSVNANAQSQPISGEVAQTAARFPLAMANVGDRVWVVQIQGGHRMARRLTDVGIVQGTEVSIISRTDSGSVVVAFHDCRIGLGAGMAHRVLVTTTPQDSAAPSLPVSATSVSDSLTPSTTGEDPMPTPTVLHLGALNVGQSGRITGYEKGNRAYREKLLSMGLTPGTQFVVTRQAPMGDPIEVEVRGFKLSLRKNEAAVLIIEPTTTGENEEANHE